MDARAKADPVSSVAMRTLVAISYSPWSEKARWALDHRGIDYRFENYTPMLGEPGLRLRARKLRGKVSVPVLFDDAKVIFESIAIARHGEALAGGRVLFPEGRDAEIAAWSDKSEVALFAGRAVLLKVMARDEKSQLESMPKFIPRALRQAMVPVAGLGVRFVARKYSSPEADVRNEAKLDETLRDLRSALKHRKTLLSSGFSYADIAMATVLQGVLPVAQEYLPLGPATRELWTHAVLAARYPDLLAWRDELYAANRNKKNDEK